MDSIFEDIICLPGIFWNGITDRVFEFVTPFAATPRDETNIVENSHDRQYMLR
jgi:hypothetical protein